MLLNIPPLYRSKLHFINLLAVVNANHLKRYGFDQVMRPAMIDLKKLAEEVSINIHNYEC